MLTTKEIQKLIAKAQVEKGHSPVVENFTYLPFEMDVMSISGAGFMYEFEVKISRQDFKKDLDKLSKHIHYQRPQLSDFTTSPNYFYYVCREGMIKANELPVQAGLIYVIALQIKDKPETLEYRLSEIVKAPLIHKQKHDLQPLLKKVCRVQAERLYLGGCKMTVKNKAIKSRREEKLRAAGFTGEILTKALKK